MFNIFLHFDYIFVFFNKMKQILHAQEDSCICNTLKMNVVEKIKFVESVERKYMYLPKQK